MEYKDPGRYIPIMYLLYSWGSLFGVPSRVPLYQGLNGLEEMKGRSAASASSLSANTGFLGGFLGGFISKVLIKTHI